jgi:hypothetical protein
MTRRSARRLATFAAACALFALGAAPALAGGAAHPARARPAARSGRTLRQAEASARPLTALQFAAIEGMTYSDRTTYVLLETGAMRLRLYPGTAVVVSAGHEYRVKDPFVRSAGDVLVTARVSRFLTRQVVAFRDAEEARRRERDAHAARYPKLPPLPPMPKRPAPAPRPVVHRAPPAPRPQAQITGDAAWVPHVPERHWKWIIVHHSDDNSGNLAKYDAFHRYKRHWENGCGYDFVIGNGTLSGDGEVEVGPRWVRQIQGAHCKVPGNRYNERGVGICLVGNFDEGGHQPTPKQLASLVRLVRWLKARYGIVDANIHGHRDCCSTRCPGRYFPWKEFLSRID